MTDKEFKGKTLMLVDDRPENLDLLVGIMGKYDVNIIVATSGEQGLERLKYTKPDIILLDIMMPGIDGFEVCRRLKESDEYQEIPVIFMSALDDPVDKIKGLELGAVDYITKPYKAEEVYARISNQFHAQDLRQQLAAMQRLRSESVSRHPQEALKNEGTGSDVTATKSRTILLVDDDEEAHYLVREYLGKYFYKINVATNCDEVYQSLKENRPDIILLDVKLPGVDGYEICRRLKGSDEYREIPIIFITVLDGVADTVKGFKLGAVDYITKPYNVEEVLARISTQIKISRLVQETQQANIKLKEIDQLKSIFIASMSHELRTPLNSIMGFNGLLRMELKEKLTEKQADYMERTRNSCHHLLNLINDILDISKIEAGVIDLSLETFNLKDVVDEALGQLQSRIEDKGLAVDISVPPELEVYSDPRRVLQCILNYLSNGVKYTEAGKINLSARELGDQVEVVVEDTGAGISKDDLLKLFQTFERLNSTARIKETGTGLGLYITKKLATETLGGSVAVESKLGEGSKFFLRFSKNLGPKEVKTII